MTIERLLITGLVLLTGCTRPSSLQTSRPSDDARGSDEVAALIESCPNWEVVRRKDTATRSKILSVMQTIATHDVKIIRSGIVKYIEARKANGQEYEFGKLLVLNSYLFALPQKYPIDGPERSAWCRLDQGGWWSPADHVDLMWPLSYGPNREIILTGVCGAYSGGAYQALTCFDEYYAKFGLRSKKR